MGAASRRRGMVMLCALFVQFLLLVAYSKVPVQSRIIHVSSVTRYLESDSITQETTTGLLQEGPPSTRVLSPIWLNRKSPSEKCQKSFPTAIIAGIQKCGTTALIKFLGLHPQIVYPHGEVKFFTTRYNRGLKWYKNRMPCSRSEQIAIERSPGYFYRSYAAQRIKEFNPDIKLIFIIKDPIVRAQSMYAMVYRNNDSGFQTVITDDNGEIINDSKIIQYSSYSTHMKPWLDLFRLDQISFIDGHNFERHPEEELRKLEKFLNLAPFFGPENFWINKDKGKPCFYKKRNRLHCLTRRKGRSHPEIGDDFRKTLESHFKPLNEQFFSMINHRYDWGY